MNCLKALAHIAIYTESIAESVAFYEKLGGVCTAHAEAAKSTGVNQLALVDWAGMTLELIEPHDGTVLSKDQTAPFPHIAVAVDDLDAAVAQLRAAGIVFLTDAPVEMPQVFGGLRNIFFLGINAEKIELLQML